MVSAISRAPQLSELPTHQIVQASEAEAAESQGQDLRIRWTLLECFMFQSVLAFCHYTQRHNTFRIYARLSLITHMHFEIRFARNHRWLAV